MVTTTNLIEIIRGTNSQIYGGLPIVKHRAEGYAQNDCNLTTEKEMAWFWLSQFHYVASKHHQ